MKYIVLKGGYTVAVDDEDYQTLIDIGGWYVDSRGYAINDKRVNGRRVITDMHRLLHPPKRGFVTDHINQNKLDNRRANLRDATKSVNALNSGMWGHNKSGFKGVCWSPRVSKWRATINVRGKQIHLGFFSAVEEANRAYQDKLAEVLR